MAQDAASKQPPASCQISPSSCIFPRRPRYHFHSFYLDFSPLPGRYFQPPLWPSNPLTDASSYFQIQLEGVPSKVLGDTRISCGKCSVLWTRVWEQGCWSQSAQVVVRVPQFICSLNKFLSLHLKFLVYNMRPQIVPTDRCIGWIN